VAEDDRSELSLTHLQGAGIEYISDGMLGTMIEFNTSVMRCFFTHKKSLEFLKLESSIKFDFQDLTVLN